MGNIHLKAVEQLMSGTYESYYKGGAGNYLDKLVLDSIVDPSYDQGNCKKDVCYFKDYREMLRKRKIDAAIIAAPTVKHFEIACDCIEKGIHLLIEKPVACKASEIKKIRDLAAKRNLFVLPGHVERYNPVTLDIIEYLQYKVYGSVRQYEFVRTSRKPSRIPDSIIIDKLVHDLDLLLFFFGKPQINDVKFDYDKRGKVIECELCLKHKNGVRGRILSSWQIKKKQRTIEIDAERGLVHGDFLHKKLYVRRYHEFSKLITGYANNQVKDQLADFIGGIYKLAKPLVSIDDALNCGVIIDKIENFAAQA